MIQKVTKKSSHKNTLPTGLTHASLLWRAIAFFCVALPRH
jgi:hypothetical protein